MYKYFLVFFLFIGLLFSSCEKKNNENISKDIKLPEVPEKVEVAPTPSPTPKPPLIGIKKAYLTPEGYQLILDFEVGGGKPYYDKFLKYVNWPGYNSGITGGVGSDFGMVSKENSLYDWRNWSEKKWLNDLANTSGITGQKAKAILPKYKHIYINWDLAEEVFNDTVVSRWYNACAKAFPGFEELHPNAQSSLTSLAFNRGLSFSGPRREEMREIKRLIPLKDYKGIATQIRKMKRLWVGSDIEKGMARRRDREADLVLTALKD